MDTQIYREALEKIRSEEPKDGETNSKYALNRCWHLAVDALNKAALEEIAPSLPKESAEQVLAKIMGLESHIEVVSEPNATCYTNQALRSMKQYASQLQSISEEEKNVYRSEGWDAAEVFWEAVTYNVSEASDRGDLKEPVGKEAYLNSFLNKTS